MQSATGKQSATSKPIRPGFRRAGCTGVTPLACLALFLVRCAEAGEPLPSASINTEMPSGGAAGATAPDDMTSAGAAGLAAGAAGMAPSDPAPAAVGGMGGDSVLPGAAGMSPDSPPVVDMCPTDPAKTEPGTCGCNILDFDSDSDGTADCDDACPEDALKSALGDCGCGVADTGDTDLDGTADCVDTCADDPNKIEPGECGCGVAEDSCGPPVVNLPATVLHRYGFDDVGFTAADTGPGAVDGTVFGTLLTGDGMLTGASASGIAVLLPTGTISVLTSATFEAWVVWDGVGVWERVFDFGDNIGPTSYIFLTPRAVDVSGSLRVAYSTAGPAGELLIDAPGPLPIGVETHLAVVVDNAGPMTLYMDGVAQGTVVLPIGALGTINDLNDWIGFSQFLADPSFGGDILEFRIHDAALTAAQVAASFSAGPEPLPLP